MQTVKNRIHMSRIVINIHDIVVSLPLDKIVLICYHRSMDYELCKELRSEYEHWRGMLEHIPFVHEESASHARDHCARVLLFALKLAEALALPKGERDVLSTCAVFHDCCRCDDGKDVGHGRRAAEKYRETCGSYSLIFDERVYYIMAYHDRHDGEGETAIREHLKANADETLLLFRIFKDADALDRFRFGQYELNENYLRIPASHELIGFARRLNGLEDDYDTL